MADLIRIHHETVDSDAFVKRLKINGRFDELIEEFVEEKLTAHAGRALGVEASAEEVQARADQIRRVMGLHRAVEMNRWLDQMSVTLDDFETFVAEMLIIDKTLARVLTEEAVQEYFRLNSPRFEALQLSHIVVDSESKSKEIRALVEDEPDMFEDLAREHSTADTAAEGGYIGRVTRGMLINEVEAKVFHAAVGEVVGPFRTPDQGMFEIFRVNARRPAALDDATRDEILRLIRKDWLAERAREYRVELC